jgi:serine O-acetyltransferase
MRFFSDLFSCDKFIGVEVMTGNDPLWDTIVSEAHQAALEEPVLGNFFHRSLLNHASLDAALCYNLAQQLGSLTVPEVTIAEVIAQALQADSSIGESIRLDIHASFERDAACDRHLTPILYYKGFQALQLHRVSRWLWQQNRRALALFFQNQISETFAVDIHPGAQMGSGIMIDHATGLVIGETAVIGNDVSILHSVTLGGSGCAGGRRHPHIGDGVMISAGAKILGNISVGEGVKIGAGSLVLEDVPAHVTVAGVPAKIVGKPAEMAPALEMNQILEPQP